jgi:hypothetical protein
VLVDVVTVLVMPVAVVHVVDVVLVLDRVAAVTVRVHTLVLRVHLALFVLLAIVHMIHVVAVLNRCAPVIGQVLMIKFLGVRVHENSFGCWTFSFLLASLRRQATPCVGRNGVRRDYILTMDAIGRLG